MVYWIILFILWLSLGYLGFAMMKGHFVYKYPNLAYQEIDVFYSELLFIVLGGLFTLIGFSIPIILEKRKFHFIFIVKQIKDFINAK
jgi:hypothetical protein